MRRSSQLVQVEVATPVCEVGEEGDEVLVDFVQVPCAFPADVVLGEQLENRLVKHRQVVAGLPAVLLKFGIARKRPVIMPSIQHQQHFKEALKANRVVEKRR